MATRCYLPSTGAPPVSPSFDGSWEDTNDADRIEMVTTKINSALTNKAATENSTTNNLDTLFRQYVSKPLAGSGTLSGTVKGAIRAFEGSSSSNAFAQLLVKVVSNDGATVRGTALAHQTTGGGEFALSLTARRFPRASANGGLALTNTNWQDGDRIVAEIGARFQNTFGTGDTGTLNFGDNAAADLTEGETATGADNPWLEFSQDLTFQGGAKAFPFIRRDAPARNHMLRR